MGAPIVHFEIPGKDAGKLGSFYGDLFDWDVDADNPMNDGLVRKQTETSIGGDIDQAPDEQPGHVRFCVEVENLQACLDEVESMEGKTVILPTEIPDMVTFALSQDPEVNLIGIVQSEPKFAAREK